MQNNLTLQQQQQQQQQRMAAMIAMQQQQQQFAAAQGRPAGQHFPGIPPNMFAPGAAAPPPTSMIDPKMNTRPTAPTTTQGFPMRPGMIPSAGMVPTPPNAKFHPAMAMPPQAAHGHAGRPAMLPAGPTTPTMMRPSTPSLSTVQQPSLPPIEPIKAETPAQKESLQQYQQHDLAYQEILNQQHKRHLQLAQEKKREIEISTMERRTRMQGPMGVVATFGPGYQGLGNSRTGMQSKVLYPNDKKHIRRTPPVKFSVSAMKEQATKDDSLLPIRLEFEADGYKLRDTFTWNLNESLVTPEQFAQVMCEDLRLPPSSFIPQIARSIREQVQDFYLHASSMVTNEASDADDSTANKEPSDATQPPPHAIATKNNNELRMLIKLDITVGHRQLIDQFEWDIGCSQNSPEEFSEMLANDLGLGGEFKTAIAHSIREQVHVYTKSLLVVGHEFDGPVVDDDLKHSFLPPVQSVVRETSALELFTPAIMELSDAELLKNEKDRLREARRKRRQTRGRRGIILPDREPLKTNRTNHETQPDIELTDEQFFANVNMPTNGFRGSTPEGTHSQRKSAMRARQNIAAEAAGHDGQTPPHGSPRFIAQPF
ncbi:SNF5-domain-containing protein [Hesseltinella vesiculosa]|uniref:SNF5-domain-containing protein n=1 Tax=Hesseltinella vesiculosa TaxID=101127 RepID=A0A1X2GCB7_9FUNG|nr:SNF5-domain-containing protein [Hesseltinella vesiculosa]